LWHEEAERWRIASHRQNSRGWKPESGRPQPDSKTLNYANPLYISFKGGIDPEFARAKAVKHGLNKLGTNPNAVHAERITIEPKGVVIDPKIDQEALAEEVAAPKAGEPEYTEHEEISSAPLEVQVVEEAKKYDEEKAKEKIKAMNDLKSKIPTVNDL